MPRVAYLVTSYKLPDQALRLASVLRAGSRGGFIAIHHDNRRCELDRTALEALGVGLIEPPSAVEWGGFSQLAMVLRCMHWLLAHSDFDWLVLLSGQDYPVRPVAEIEARLGAAEVDAFIETVSCDRPGFRRETDEFAARYYYRWRRLPLGFGPRFAHLAEIARPVLRARVMPDGVWLALPALRSPFGPQLICHRGLDWFTLSRRAVESVDLFARSRPEVLEFYRRTLIPTEGFVHTLLASDHRLRLSGDHRRYCVFDGRHRSRPRVLQMRDLDSVLSSSAHFARKFDETVDRDVLDELDRRFH